jgi:hypothetical protein
MTPATASSQGYTSANDYSPTLGTSPTVGAGTSLASSCSTLSALCNGTTGGCSYNSTSHTVTCPATVVNARLSAWDVGAYQFKSGSSTPPSNPPSVTAVVH